MSEDLKNMGDITEDDKLWAALSLAIPIVALIVLFIEEKNARPFIRYAAVNSLVVAAVMFVLGIVLGIVPIIQCISFPLSLVIWIYMIYQGIQAYNGTWVVIPFATDFAKGQNWI